MRWITAIELERWAPSNNAKVAFPEIISDLIRASADDIAAIRFPSGDKGQIRGFDGVLDATAQGLNVPLGRSYWELGTTADYKGKARDDFQKRTSEVSAADQAQATLVLVSARTWDDPTTKIEDWVADLKSNSSWNDVRFIDGSALENWLDACPAVAAWHARTTLGLRPKEGVRSSHEYWLDYTGRFSPPLTQQVLICDRKDAADRLIQNLLQSVNLISIVADSPDEVIAFAIACIRQAPPQVRLFLEARTLVVDIIEAGRDLLGRKNLILFLRGTATSSPAQLQAIGPILVALGRLQKVGGGGEVLTRPRGLALGEAMMSMGLDQTRAVTLARGCGRSLTALARLIPGGSFADPDWIGDASDLVPCVLVGGWEVSNELDKKLVELMAGGRTYPQIEMQLRRYLRASDPPFDLEGTVWKVRAPIDAFIRVGPYLDYSQIERFHAATLEVFGQKNERDVSRQTQEDETNLFGPSAREDYSEWLKSGMAMSLLLLAVMSEAAEVNFGAETGQKFANRLFEAIPGLRTAEALVRLRDELPNLAEAAPNPLLSALEYMLEGDGQRILPIFDEHAGFFHSNYHHTGVLWALETIAWDPEHFHRAVLLLAAMAAIDPGIKIANTPLHSLSEIFVLWHPNTNASLNQMLAALKDITERYPNVGWKLNMALLPRSGAIATQTAKPRLREGGAADRAAITRLEFERARSEVESLLLSVVDENEDRWLELIPRVFEFAPEKRVEAAASLDMFMLGRESGARKRVWERLKTQVARHERYSHAAWSLDASQLEVFKALSEKYQPTDPLTPVVELFDNWMIDYGVSDNSAQRISAVAELYEHSGSGAIVQLASTTKAPHLVIEAIAAANFSASELEIVLVDALRESNDITLAAGLSSILRQTVGGERAAGVLCSAARSLQLSASSKAHLFQGWPESSQTWSILRGFGVEVVDEYWKSRRPHYVSGSQRALVHVLLMLLKFGRAMEAMQSAANRLSEVPTRLLFQMLEQVIPQLNSKAVPVDSMTGYYVHEILSAIDKRPSVSLDEIAAYEYRFLPLLERNEGSLHIEQLMARKAEFYFGIFRDVFSTEEEKLKEPTDTEKLRARLSYPLLSSFSVVPQLDTEGAPTLSSWIDQVRHLATVAGLIDVAENFIGRLLAHAPSDADGGWPHRIVRSEIERLKSTELENGIALGRYNMRGVYTKEVYEGGDQERRLALEYKTYSEIAQAWPRTSALLITIANGWTRDAEREDISAAQRKLNS